MTAGAVVARSTWPARRPARLVIATWHDLPGTRAQE